MNAEELNQRLCSPEFDENQRIDFKRELEKEKQSDLAKDISAFANESGGQIFIGINNDRTVYKGNKKFIISNWQNMDSESITNATRSCLKSYWSHPLNFTIETIPYPEITQPILVINIDKSQIISGWRNSNDKSFEFWVRIDRQNNPMGISQIIDKSQLSKINFDKEKVTLQLLEFIENKLKSISSAIHTAYKLKQGMGNLTYQPRELISKGILKDIGYLKSQVVVQAEQLHTNLSGLSFLSANIPDDIKSFCMVILNKMQETIGPGSVWHLPNEELEKLKNTNNAKYILDIYFEKSNEIILLYDTVLKIIELQARNK
jgi:hypothetical protein